MDCKEEIVEFGDNLGENSIVNAPIQGACIDRIKIGKNVFINGNTLFMARGGITIEDDVPDYAVVVGNPARAIKTLDETKFKKEEN